MTLDPGKTGVLQKELTKAGVPYYMDGDLVCVTGEYADRFTQVVIKAFPPEVDTKVRIPSSPTGVAVNSAKLVNANEQAALEAELTRRGIWFTKDEAGAIWYEVTREKEVRELMLRIFEQSSKKER